MWISLFCKPHYPSPHASRAIRPAAAAIVDGDSPAALARKHAASKDQEGLPSPSTPTALPDHPVQPAAAVPATPAAGFATGYAQRAQRVQRNARPPPGSPSGAAAAARQPECAKVHPTEGGAAVAAGQPEYAEVLLARFRLELEEERATAWRRMKR